MQTAGFVIEEAIVNWSRKHSWHEGIDFFLTRFVVMRSVIYTSTYTWQNNHESF